MRSHPMITAFHLIHTGYLDYWKRRAIRTYTTYATYFSSERRYNGNFARPWELPYSGLALFYRVSSHGDRIWGGCVSGWTSSEYCSRGYGTGEESNVDINILAVSEAIEIVVHHLNLYGTLWNDIFCTRLDEIMKHSMVIMPHGTIHTTAEAVVHYRKHKNQSMKAYLKRALLKDLETEHSTKAREFHIRLCHSPQLTSPG